MGSLHSYVHFQRASHPRAMPAACLEKILYLEASKKKVQITDKFFRRDLLGHQGTAEYSYGAGMWKCLDMQNCQKTAS